MIDSELQPVLYIPHGGGPLPLLGEPGHAQLVKFLKTITTTFKKPSAIVVISAHYEAAVATVLSGANPELYYDYYNFPAEAYEICYPARGNPALAQRVIELLADSDISAVADTQRGFDHGMFVPLKLMYPDADIPCIELSLLEDMSPARHIAMGRAIACLREQGVLILGSGSSYHNMQRLRPGTDPSPAELLQFDQWLIESCSDADLTKSDREQRLLNWLAAPHARFCHPREEHLLPLHVCLGAALQHSKNNGAAELVFNQPMMGRELQAFLWR